MTMATASTRDNRLRRSRCLIAKTINPSATIASTSPLPRNATTPIGAARFTLVNMSIRHFKALCFAKLLDKKRETRGSGHPHLFDQGLHVVEIVLQSAATCRSQFVFSLG